MRYTESDDTSILVAPLRFVLELGSKIPFINRKVVLNILKTSVISSLCFLVFITVLDLFLNGKLTNSVLPLHTRTLALAIFLVLYYLVDSDKIKFYTISKIAKTGNYEKIKTEIKEDLRKDQAKQTLNLSIQLLSQIVANEMRSTNTAERLVDVLTNPKSEIRDMLIKSMGEKESIDEN